MKLVHNKPISRRTDFKMSDEMVPYLRDALREKQTTEKPERVYFLWFLYLKLLLELEEKKLCIIVGGHHQKVGKSRKEIYVGKDIKNIFLYGSTTAVETCGQDQTVKEILDFLP